MRSYILMLLSMIPLCGIAQSSRLVATARSNYNTNISDYILKDSTRYNYSGTRGGDLATPPLKFDDAIRWLNNSGVNENDARYEQTFDNNNNMLTRLLQDWNGSAWVNGYNTEFTYDGNNNMLTLNNLQWYNNTWNATTRQVFSYDLNNNRVRDTAYSWNGTIWVGFESHVYYKNTNGLDSAVLRSYWNGNNWMNDQLDLYVYDGNNMLIEKTEKIWDANNSIWINDHKIEYAITNGNVASITTYDWVSNNWMYIGTTINTYDNNGDMVFVTTANVARHIYTYNNMHQRISYKYEMWLNNDWSHEFSNAPWERYYYEEYTNSIEDIDAGNQSFLLYPVPAVSSIRIEMNWDEPEQFTVAILDMQGKMVQHIAEKPTTNYTRNIDISQLPAGNYLMRVAGENSKTLCRQFTVVH